METNLAVGPASLVVAAKVNVDCLSTSTLCILDSGPVLLARDRLLSAGGTIVHSVVEIDFDIKLNGHVDSGDTEAILFLVTTKGSRLRFAAFVLYGFAAKSPLSERIALANRVGAFPVLREVEVTILEVGVAVLEVRPVEPVLLLIATLVVCVLRRLERLTRDTPGSSCLLGGNGCQNSISGLHGGCERFLTMDGLIEVKVEDSVRK
jgi:hypothetical protein